MTRRVRAGGLAAALASIVLLGARPAIGHTGPHDPSSTPSPASVAPDPAPATSPATTASSSPMPTSPPETQEPQAPVTVGLRDALFEHLHNKIVHFPLALGCAAALLLLLSYRWPQYWPAARLLLFLAAAAAVAAYFSGQAQEEPFEDGPLNAYFERHERLGKISGIALWAGVALSFVPRARRWLWLYALLLVALLSATGFLGGILSHTAI